jgi:hypothetical protein
MNIFAPIIRIEIIRITDAMIEIQNMIFFIFNPIIPFHTIEMRRLHFRQPPFFFDGVFSSVSDIDAMSSFSFSKFICAAVRRSVFDVGLAIKTSLFVFIGSKFRIAVCVSAVGGFFFGFCFAFRLPRHPPQQLKAVLEEVHQLIRRKLSLGKQR